MPDGVSSLFIPFNLSLHGQEQVPAAIHYEPRGMGKRLWEDDLPEPIENSIEYFIRHILEVTQFDL